MRSPANNGLTVLIVERRDAAAWALVPELVRRVGAFCAKYDSDAKPEVLCEALIRSFVEPRPGLIGMLLCTPDKGVTGHLVVTLEEWMGVKMATIVQIESDEPLTADIIEAPLEFLDRWAALNGAQFFQCLARNEIVARLFRQKYGFEQKRILMRKRVEPVVVDDEGKPQVADWVAETVKRGEV